MNERADVSADLSRTRLDETMPIPVQEAGVGAVAREPRPIQLEVLGGPMDGLRARSQKSPLTVGRSRHNDLALPLDEMVSASHAQILRVGRTFILEDMGSRNGTSVGGRQLAKRELFGPGGVFKVGRTKIEFTPL